METNKETRDNLLEEAKMATSQDKPIIAVVIPKPEKKTLRH